MSIKTLLLCLSALTYLNQAAAEVDQRQLPEVNGDKFYYFGYGSNMLTKRIHIQNPTAVKIGVGSLQNYRLDFNNFTARWNGAPATIVPTEKAIVYGTLWEIDMDNMDDIDNQEGVHEGIYSPVNVSISHADKDEIFARAYVLVDQPQTDIKSFGKDEVLLERQPSKTYLQCLVKGALETGIPTEYVNWLKSLPNNGRVAEDLEQMLDLQNVELL